MRVLVGCPTTNAESAAFLHNAEVLTLCSGFTFTLPTTRFSSFQLSSFFFTYFLIPRTFYEPFSLFLSSIYFTYQYF
jgi:hypothetical protein